VRRIFFYLKHPLVVLIVGAEFYPQTPDFKNIINPGCCFELE
jgi:hypothetical protein